MTTDNTNTTTKSESGSGGGFGSKLKGAAQVIHGFGDNIRGSALGAADRATSSTAGVQKNDDLATKGRAEIAEGMAMMKGHAPAARGAPTETTPAGTAPSGTAPAGQGTTAEAGTGAGTGAATGAAGGAAVGGAAAGVTDQDRQRGTGDEKSSAVERKTGPEPTGSGAAQTGREAAVGAGAVQGQAGTGAGTGAKTGTGAGTGAATGGAAAGVTDQGRQQGTGYEKSSATVAGKTVPESTGPGATQTGREAAVGAGALQGPGETAAGTGAAPEQKQQYPSAVSQEEEKHDERNVPERSQSGDTGQNPAQSTTEDRPQQKAEVSQKGVQEGEPSKWVDHGKEKIHFLGISTDDEGGEQPSQQTTEKTCAVSHEGTQQEDARAAQEGGKIRFQDFQGCGI
ncbi:hypothetical protein BDR06DRAFT_970388 [Suillus hirtellus]|nr:hypothetical protein BDR06DRAFT_970388 [Suillus hirtellus]